MLQAVLVFFKTILLFIFYLFAFKNVYFTIRQNQFPFISFISFIEIFVVTLVNKIIQVSGVQFYNTSFVHCIVCLPPQLKFPITVCPLLSAPFYILLRPFPCGSNHHIVVCVYEVLFFSCLIPSPFSPSTSSTPALTAVSLLSMSLFLFHLLVYFVNQIAHMSEIIWYLSFS